MKGDRRRFEPWPIALAACLAFMIVVCVAFWWTAERYADVELVHGGTRPGVARAGAEPGR